METFKKIKKKKIKLQPMKTTLSQKHKHKLNNFNKNIKMLPTLKKNLEILTKKLKILKLKKNNNKTYWQNRENNIPSDMNDQF